MRADYDIVVVGAGLTGACAAALLVRHAGIEAQRIALLSSELPSAGTADAPPDLRVVAISRASERVLRAAGAWQRLDQARLCAYERMRVWHESSAATGDAALCFDAADIGEPNLGFIAENGALVRACIDSFREAGGALITGQLASVSVGAEFAQLECSDGSDITARLVVGADGAQSLVRDCAGLAVRTREYRQLAIVATVRTERAHENTAWQRFLRTGPLALLPLFDGSSSIVWSVDEAQAVVLRDCSGAEFSQRLEAAADGVLGATTLASERLSFPLRSMAAQSYVAPRCALIGDAAHVIHPLAGQGANLGLLDAAALCEAVATAKREDPGALRVLRGYEQQRRTHNLFMDAAMSALHSGFGVTRGPAAWLLNRGLAVVNRSSTLKRAFARQALGTAGALPRLARARLVEPVSGD
ncbi:MAG TPA: FAD-dependent monooxygenase [Steroidobacteraceae bacterium]|nr:FAD-dependent monooxygenase [Steroidobacteraceae bacterium]